MRQPDKLDIQIPDFALVVLIGASGSGKSTFAAKHFRSTEVISSDYCRGLVSDDETDQDATGDAFELVRFMAEKRLKRRKLTVIDATNVRAPDRKHWIEIARKWHAVPIAVVIERGSISASSVTSCVPIARSEPALFNAWFPKSGVACADCNVRGFDRSGNCTRRKASKPRTSHVNRYGRISAQTTDPSISSAIFTAARTSWSRFSRNSAIPSPGAKRKANVYLRSQRRPDERRFSSAILSTAVRAARMSSGS